MIKILLSPSKGQSAPYSLNVKKEKPYAYDKSEEVRELMMSLDKENLGKALKVKGDLLDKTYELFHHSNESKTAIETYSGLVFKQLDLETYSDEQLQYLQDHLVILSAMYGVLKPFTAIKPYRLDMKASIEGIDLYKFWRETVNDYLKPFDWIINLSSNEFFKLINKKAFKSKIIDIHFKEYNKNGKLRVVAARAKKARGLFLNKVIKNQISEVENLKNISVIGYNYREDLSSENELYFIK